MVKQHAVQISDNSVIEQPTLRILQRRWEEWKDEGMPSCDPLLLDVLPRFNANKNIVTVFGCSGHMEIDADEDFDNTAYIMFAANAEGISWLFNFHNLLICSIESKNLRCLIDISFGHSIFPMGDMEFTYPSVVIRAHFNQGLEDQFAFFAAINNTLTHSGL